MVCNVVLYCLTLLKYYENLFILKANIYSSCALLKFTISNTYHKSHDSVVHGHSVYVVMHTDRTTCSLVYNVMCDEHSKDVD